MPSAALRAALAISVVVACVSLGVAALAGPKPNTLPQVYVSGSNYEIGHAYGATYAAQIKAAMAASGSLKQVTEFVATPDGKKAYDAFIANVQASPMAVYLDELRGIAAGSGIDYTSITLLNMLDELGPLAKGAGWHRVDSCSDILVQLPTGDVLLGHNEDANTNDLGNTYVSTATSAAGGTFSAYTYPGQLPGGAFGFNSAGVFFSTNAVFPKDISLAGVPRNFLQRYLLDASSVQDAITKATTNALASGFSLNIGSYTEANQLYNVELNSAGHDVLRVTSHYAHFNMYLRLNVPQYTDISSVARLAEYEKLPVPTDTAGIFNILGNQANSTWPVYRTATPPDSAMTLATALFSSEARQMGVVMNNPITSKPLFHLAMGS